MQKHLFVALIFLLWSLTSLAAPRVLMVSAEKSGVFQTGGLGHAVEGLAQALNAQGVPTDSLMPFYLQMNTPANLQYSPQHFQAPLDWRDGVPQRASDFFLLKDASTHGSTYFLKHNPAPGQTNYFDNRSANGRKFYGPDVTIGEAIAAWSKASADFILSQNYDIVVLNDWHTGLIALYLNMARAQGKKVPKIVMAIHNMAFQGVFSYEFFRFLGIPNKYFTPNEGVEFYGQMNFLKAGMQYSDVLYTVSTGYAKEIATPLFGAGLDGLVRHLQQQKRVTGVLNGILNEQWDPSRKYNPAIEWTFTPEDLSGKALGKAQLQKELNLPVRGDVPVFILTSRVAEQKGYEYLIDAMDTIAATENVQFAVIGDGDAKYIERLQELQQKYPEKVRYNAFSERLEKQLTAYGDFFVNAAWFEPSGLNQFFALKNGTIPVLSRVGGLADSIQEGKTGFFFNMVWNSDQKSYNKEATRDSLVKSLRQAALVYMQSPTQIRQMRTTGMRIDNSWQKRVKAEILPMFSYALAGGPKTLQAQHPEISSAGLNPSDLLKATEGLGMMCESLF